MNSEFAARLARAGRHAALGLALACSPWCIARVGAVGTEADTGRGTDPIGCADLRARPDAQQALPGALSVFCGRARAVQSACAARSGQACTDDAACERSYGSPKCFGSGGPCLPTVEYKGCVAASPATLSRLLRQYRPCLATGGRWEQARNGSGGKRRYDVTCTCGKAPTVTRIDGRNTSSAEPRNRLYLEDRGCIGEDELCRTRGGVWTSVPPPGYPRGADRLYCNISGRPATWGMEPGIGFPQ